jgi:hypothetical protein
MVNVQARRASRVSAASPATVVAAALLLAGACRAVSVWLMQGMDTGIATRPGSFGFCTAAAGSGLMIVLEPSLVPWLMPHRCNDA